MKIQFRGTTIFEDEDRPSKGQGTWTFTGGAGKAKGITGSGHYTGTFESDGSASWLVTGRYALSGAH